MHELQLVKKIEHTVRTKGILPDVNANINRLIYNKIQKEIEKEDADFFRQLKNESNWTNQLKWKILLAFVRNF